MVRKANWNRFTGTHYNNVLLIKRWSNLAQCGKFNLKCVLKKILEYLKLGMEVQS